MASNFIVVYLIYLRRFFALSLETLKIFSFFSKSSKMLYFGVKEKKMVVVCALLEHEIIMMIPAVAEPVVEFKLLKKCLRYSAHVQRRTHARAS